MYKSNTLSLEMLNKICIEPEAQKRTVYILGLTDKMGDGVSDKADCQLNDTRDFQA